MNMNRYQEMTLSASVIRRTVKNFGLGGAHVTLPYKMIGKEVIVVAMENPELVV